MSDGIRCLWMRGGTSKGGYFLADDLPADGRARDSFLLGVMGSPDPRQIDGLGGGDPLTSKVAVVKKSARPGVDVDYLFLQVLADRAVVSDAQTCGNILAGVGPFAIERGLVAARDGETRIVIHMENTGRTAVARVRTPDGRITYAGDARIDGVPGTAAPVRIAFRDTAGATCGAVLPTGEPVDTIDGTEATCIDNGMPVVILRAADLGVSGTESPGDLDANGDLKRRLETIRLKAGPMMRLGDVTDKTVPKVCLVAPPGRGGTVTTRTFVPHRCHAAIGVLGVVSVVAACMIPGTPGASVAVVPDGRRKRLSIEHPGGEMTVTVDTDAAGAVTGAAVLRTARKLFDGMVFAP